MGQAFGCLNPFHLPLDAYTATGRRRGIAVQWPARARGKIKGRIPVQRHIFMTCPGDHRRIIGTQIGRRNNQIKRQLLCQCFQPRANFQIGRYPAGNDQLSGVCFIGKFCIARWFYL